MPFLDPTADVEYLFNEYDDSAIFTPVDGESLTVRCISLSRERQIYEQDLQGMINNVTRRFIVPVADVPNGINVDDTFTYQDEYYTVKAPPDGAINGAYIVETESRKMYRPGPSGIIR